MASLTLNFGFRSSAQSLESTMREVNKATDYFARMIVEDVVYAQSGYTLDTSIRTLRQGIHREVMAELDNLAMTIGNSLAITERARGPQGTMKINGEISQTMIKRGWPNAPFNRRSTGIKWDRRNPKYIRWKKSNGLPGDWWRASDDLAGYLSRASVYTDSFGPIRVTVSRPRDQVGRLARVGSSPRVTSSGMRGPVTVEREIATVRVTALGRITVQDLPSLGTEDPKDAKPTNGKGVARLIENDEARAKLQQGAWKTGQQRFVLEPFLSFFLTRQLPNAVWRRIERQPVIENTRGRSGDIGTGSSFNRSY